MESSIRPDVGWIKSSKGETPVTTAEMMNPPVSITSTACLACGHDSWVVEHAGLTDYLTDEAFSIHRCDHCDLQITQPLPAGDSIGSYYPRQYRGNRHAFTGKLRCTLRQKAVQGCFDKDFRGRLLDIGCGDGSFALEMKAHGWNVSATEIDPHTIARLRDAGISAFLSDDAEAHGFGEKFDAITCWHVLEHVSDPWRVARWVRSHLSENGIFQATVPNVESLQARVFGRHWMHLDVPRHRQHFTPATLRALLQAAGFRIEQQSNFAWEYDLFGVIQSALNCVCSRSNVLFDKLTHAPARDEKPGLAKDVFLSYALAPVIALLGAPAVAIAALAGDGATLTVTARA